MAFIHEPLEFDFRLKQITEPNGERWYVHEDGSLFESVTTFIGRHSPDKELKAWIKRVGEEEAERIGNHATNRGKIIHSVVEQYLLNEELKFTNPLTKARFYKIKPFVDKINHIKIMERPLYSRQLMLAGTPDIIGEYNGVLSTIDLKGSTHIKQREYQSIRGYFYQTAAYSIMYKEHFGVMPEKAVLIIATDQDPQPTVFVEDVHPIAGAFLYYKDQPEKLFSQEKL